MFDLIRTDGQRFRHGLVWCSVVDDSSVVPPQVAYAVGRPVGAAVTRNRVRRRLRALMADEARNGFLPGGYYLVGAGSGAAAAPFSVLAADVHALVTAIGRGRGRG